MIFERKIFNLLLSLCSGKVERWKLYFLTVPTGGSLTSRSHAMLSSFYFTLVIVSSCRDLEASPFSQLSCTNSYFFRSRCTLSCDAGYEMVGNSVSTCGANGRWKGNL